MLPNKTTLCLLVLLLYWATLQSASAQSPATGVTTAAAAAAAPSAAGATAGSAVCSLSLAGFGDRLGIKSAKLSCTGGTITIAAHKLLRDFWGPTMVLPGVVWGNQECVTNDGCLISICGGSNAVFNLASVSALKGGGDKPEVRIAVCVNRQSTVTFRNSTFTGLREITSMAIHTAGTSALVDQCTLRDNVYTLDGHYSSGIVVDMARLTILSSTLAGITGVGNAGAVTALTMAHVTIQDTKFQSNTATNGGAIHAEVNSTVVIQSSSFTGNKASERGGAIFARGQARVEVLRNRPGKCSCSTTCIHFIAVLDLPECCTSRGRHTQAADCRRHFCVPGCRSGYMCIPLRYTVSCRIGQQGRPCKAGSSGPRLSLCAYLRAMPKSLNT
jgi:predicted outer membrane repeat protein